MVLNLLAISIEAAEIGLLLEKISEALEKVGRYQATATTCRGFIKVKSPMILLKKYKV